LIKAKLQDDVAEQMSKILMDNGNINIGKRMDNEELLNPCCNGDEDNPITEAVKVYN